MNWTNNKNIANNNSNEFHHSMNAIQFIIQLNFIAYQIRLFIYDKNRQIYRQVVF